MKEILVLKIQGFFSSSFSRFATRCLLAAARKVCRVSQELLYIRWESTIDR